MKTVFSKIANSSKRLRADTSGLAMVEFALSLPVFLTLSFGGIETANYTLSNLRVSQMALAVADNAGRVRTSIDESDIDEVMIGARLLGEGIKFGANGRIILSSLESNGLTGANAGQMIRWQRCFGAKVKSSTYGAEAAGTTNATLAAGMGPSGRKITAASGTAVMFVEIFYTYQPAVMNSILGTKEITYTAAYTIRERASQTMTNTSSMTTAQKRLCTNYSST